MIVAITGIEVDERSAGDADASTTAIQNIQDIILIIVSNIAAEDSTVDYDVPSCAIDATVP